MNICNYCEHEKTCTNKPLATTRCKDYKEKSEELKPCPFCGYGKILQNSGDGYFISCRKCHSRGSKKMYYESMSDAITAWNTRPIENEKDKEITKLKEDLEIQKNLTRQACFESNRAYDETEQWKKMFYDLVDKQAIVDTNPKVVIIGKDTDVPTNATDNNVGSMEKR